MATLNIKKFPDDLYEQLQKIAGQEHRSLSQEVIYLLRRAIRSKEKRSLLELRGLGKKHWEHVDVGAYIENERSEWDQQ